MNKLTSGFLIAALLTSCYCSAQTSLKEQALEEFKKEHYDRAVTLMEQAAKQSPRDAEAYYYLGFFNHYRAYDSRPLQGHNTSYSQKVLGYLDKALALKPDYGDAKYFYGAECGGNAFIELQRGNIEGLKAYYKKAFDKGAYPEWRLEQARNTMARCDQRAILFTGGGSDTDPCFYLQQVEGFRKDLSIIALPNLDRPWYVRCIRNGVGDAIKPVKLSIADEQLDDMHPYKWDATPVAIPVSRAMAGAYGLGQGATMDWTVEPDLSSQRMHAKIEGEQAKPRTFLSAQRAVLLQLVEDNIQLRPIFFSNMVVPQFYGGLEAYFQSCGLVSRLTPVKTAGTAYAIDAERMQALFTPDNFHHYATYRSADIPRISGTLFSYQITFLTLAEYYRKANKKEELAALAAFYKTYLAPALDPNEANEIINEAQGTLTGSN